MKLFLFLTILIFAFNVKCFAYLYPGSIYFEWNSCDIVATGKFIKIREKDKSAEFKFIFDKIFKGPPKSELKFIKLWEMPARMLYLGIFSEAHALAFIKLDEPTLFQSYIGAKLKNAEIISPGKKEKLFKVINTLYEYDNSSDSGKKRIILQHLNDEDKDFQRFVQFEIVKIKFKEALPLLKKKIREPGSDYIKLGIAETLRFMKDPDVGQVLIYLLNDPSFQKKVNIIEEMLRTGDKTMIPEIEKHIYSKDELVAERARSALLRAGKREMIPLLLDMAEKGKNRIARSNALHYIWGGGKWDFTEEEKKMLTILTGDKDPSISETADRILEDNVKKADN